MQRWAANEITSGDDGEITDGHVTVDRVDDGEYRLNEVDPDDL